MPNCGCDDLFAHRSDSCDDSGAGTGVNRTCPENIVISFDPPPGSNVVFPIRLTMSAVPSTAVIRYTTDGTDPDDTSTIYTGQIEVANTSITIKARGYIEGCNDGEIFTATWNTLDWFLGFGVFCTPITDFVGQWDTWAANGTNDLRWALDMVNHPTMTITRIELYQLDQFKQWTTGAAWCTAKYIPLPDGSMFHAFPLQVRSGGVPINTNYQDTFGAFPAATRNWVLHGEPWITPANWFMLKMVIAGQPSIYAYVHWSDCDDPPPPPCPTIAKPAVTVTANCKEIRIDFTLDAIFDTVPPSGLNVWRLYRATLDPCGPGTWSLIHTGNGVGAQTYLDSGAPLTHGCYYKYQVSAEITDPAYAHCEPWIFSPPTDPVTPADEPEITEYYVEETQINSGDSVHIHYGTEHVGALATDIELYRKVGSGAFAKIADAGSGLVPNQPNQHYTDVPAGVCGANSEELLTYQLRVTRTTCGIVASNDSVTILCPVCIQCLNLGGYLAPKYKVYKLSDSPPNGASGWDQLCNPVIGGQPMCPFPTSGVACHQWDGRLWRSANCEYGMAGGSYDCSEPSVPWGDVNCLHYYDPPWSYDFPLIPVSSIIVTYQYIDPSTCRWLLGFYSVGFGPSPGDFCNAGGIFWEGIKNGGLSPVGLYVGNIPSIADPNKGITSLWVGPDI